MNRTVASGNTGTYTAERTPGSVTYANATDIVLENVRDSRLTRVATPSDQWSVTFTGGTENTTVRDFRTDDARLSFSGSEFTLSSSPPVRSPPDGFDRVDEPVEVRGVRDTQQAPRVRLAVAYTNRDAETVDESSIRAWTYRDGRWTVADETWVDERQNRVHVNATESGVVAPHGRVEECRRDAIVVLWPGGDERCECTTVAGVAVCRQ